MAELKPCPFCGKQPTLIENKIDMRKILYGYSCMDDEHHEAAVGYYKSISQAAEAWNRRKEEDRE